VCKAVRKVLLHVIVVKGVCDNLKVLDTFGGLTILDFIELLWEQRLVYAGAHFLGAE
jgi:hypothetical protein